MNAYKGGCGGDDPRILKLGNERISVATGYGLDDRRVRVRGPVESRIFSSPCRQNQLWGPPSLLSNGVKRPGHEA
jgi:hypothetical protein